MLRLKYLLLFIISIVVASCSNVTVGADGTYYNGTLQVLAAGDSKPFVRNNVECAVEINETEGVMNLTMFNVKFAAGMPLTIDFTLNDIPCVVTEDAVIFTFEGYKEPSGIAKKFATIYAFSKIEGVVTGSSLSFEATCKKGDFSFVTN